MYPKHDEEATDYGVWHTSTPETLSMEDNLNSPEAPEEIWPNWNSGVPTKFHRGFSSPPFYKDGVHYSERQHYATLTFDVERSLSVIVFDQEYGAFAKH